MFNIKSIVLLATLLKLAAADQCTTDFCRIDCPAPICEFIDKGVSDPFEKFIRVGYKCACKPPLIVAVYPPQYDFLDCEKVKEITPEHDGLQIAGNWVCSSHPYVHNSTAEKPSKPETPATEPTVADKKAVCDVIVDSEAISPVYVDASAKYQNGDKFKCLGNYIGKSYFRNSYACEKQLDAGFSASNRGKHIVDNTWVCDVTRISDSDIFAGLARISEHGRDLISDRYLKSEHSRDLARISAGLARISDSDLAPIFSKSSKPKAHVTAVSKSSECKKEVCDVIVNGTSRVPGYDAAYQDGDKCLCLGDYIGKSYLRKEYNCEKQLDAGFSASNRGKHIVDNTWVCDVTRISDGLVPIFGGLARISASDLARISAKSSKSSKPKALVTKSSECKKEVCDVIVNGTSSTPGYDADYQNGDKCKCLGDYIGKSYFRNSYACEKQLDAGFSASNRGKHIVDNTWVCDVRKISAKSSKPSKSAKPPKPTVA